MILHSIFKYNILFKSSSQHPKRSLAVINTPCYIESRNLRPRDTKSLALSISNVRARNRHMWWFQAGLCLRFYTPHYHAAAPPKLDRPVRQPWATGGDIILEMWLVPTETYTGYKIQYFLRPRTKKIRV